MLLARAFAAGHDFRVKLFSEVLFVGAASGLNEDRERAVGFFPEGRNGGNGLLKFGATQWVLASKNNAAADLGIWTKTAFRQIFAGRSKIGQRVITGSDIVVHGDG